MTEATLSARVAAAQAASSSETTITECLAVLKDTADDDDALKAKEQAIAVLSSKYAKENKRSELIALIQGSRDFFILVSKAKAAKLLRAMVDDLMKVKGDCTNDDIKVCTECIEWATKHKRTFLRQGLEARLITMYLTVKEYSTALQKTNSLLKELKKLDDKGLLVEVQLNESRIYYGVGNLSKARSALTAARMTANAIYVPPLLQASMDMQSGVLHAEEKDFRTSYSYFFESFEQYDSVSDERAALALKYMLLSKVMMGDTADVQALVQGKSALRYTGPDVDSMWELAVAHKNRSLAEFEGVLEKRKNVLEGDLVVKGHLSALLETLFGQNLSRLIEPFSVVQVAHIAKLIDLPVEKVEMKLSQMILDKEISGILDQGHGNLILYEPHERDVVNTGVVETIEHLNEVVDSLYKRSQRLG